MNAVKRLNSIVDKAKTGIEDMVKHAGSSRPGMLASDFLENFQFVARHPYAMATIGAFAAGGFAQDADAQHKVGGNVLVKEDSAGVEILRPQEGVDVYVFEHDGDLLDMTQTFKEGHWTPFIAKWASQVGVDDEIPLAAGCDMEVIGANPVNQKLEFKTRTRPGQEPEVAIYNTLGQEVGKVNNGGATLNLASGLYFARNETEGCNETGTFVVSGSRDVRFELGKSTPDRNPVSSSAAGKMGIEPADSIFISILGEEFGFRKEGTELDVGNLFIGLDEGERAVDEIREVPFTAYEFSNGMRGDKLDLRIEENDSGGFNLIAGDAVAEVYKRPIEGPANLARGLHMNFTQGDNIEFAAFAGHPYEVSIERGDGATSSSATRTGILPAIWNLHDDGGEEPGGLATVTGRLIRTSQEDDSYSFSELEGANVEIRDSFGNVLGSDISELVASDKPDVDSEYAVFNADLSNTAGLDSFFVYVDPTAEPDDEETFGYAINPDETGLQDISNVIYGVPAGKKAVDRSANATLSVKSIQTGEPLEYDVEVTPGGLSITGEHNIQAVVYHKPASERADRANILELQTPDGFDYEICLFPGTQGEACAGRGSGAPTDFTTTGLPALVNETDYVMRE